jgi:hypothetical protein
MTQVANRQIAIECRAPSDLFSAYEPLFNRLVAELRILAEPGNG